MYVESVTSVCYEWLARPKLCRYHRAGNCGLILVCLNADDAADAALPGAYHE